MSFSNPVKRQNLKSNLGSCISRSRQSVIRGNIKIQLCVAGLNSTIIKMQELQFSWKIHIKELWDHLKLQKTTLETQIFKSKREMQPKK